MWDHRHSRAFSASYKDIYNLPMLCAGGRQRFCRRGFIRCHYCYRGARLHEQSTITRQQMLSFQKLQIQFSPNRSKYRRCPLNRRNRWLTSRYTILYTSSYLLDFLAQEKTGRSKLRPFDINPSSRKTLLSRLAPHLVPCVLQSIIKHNRT